MPVSPVPWATAARQRRCRRRSSGCCGAISATGWRKKIFAHISRGIPTTSCGDSFRALTPSWPRPLPPHCKLSDGWQASKLMEEGFMSLFPIFLKLAGRPCLVVGAGNIALAKIESLMQAGADVRVISPEALPEIRTLAHAGQLAWLQREYETGDCSGSFLVIAATDSAQVNHQVFNETTEREILCNAVDDPPFCDFYFPSVVRRGALQIAISTEGESPAVAQRMRREIDAALPADLGPWLAAMG